MVQVQEGAPGLCLAMNSGVEDTVVLTGDVPSFVEVVGNHAAVNVIKAAVQENGICDVAINAIPEYFRTPTYGTGHIALLDPEVRRAIMMTLNKDYINEVLLQGLSTEAASVIDPGFWHKVIENQLPYDPAAARAYLEANGWTDGDDDGYLEATSTAFGVQKGYFEVGTELSGIRCQAPDTDPTYGYIALVWEGCAEQAGIGLIPTIESEITMINEAWYQADYDIWIWHWGWGPEPIGGALSCWLTSEIEGGGDNCQGPMGEWWVTADNYTDSPYVDAAMIDEFDMDGVEFIGFSSFDQNYSMAAHTLDIDDRKVLVDRLQQMIYDSYTENPPYYDLGLYAYTDERFVGWGDWAAHTGRTTMSDLLWLWFDLAPRGDNLPPVFDTPLLPAYEAAVGEMITFEVVVHDPDGDPIMVNWSFGDGEMTVTELTMDTAVPQTVLQSHVYTAVAADLELWVSIHDMVQ
ncbi:MAG: ABC transporter substrate-binding protein, partial [Thermoplasmata archaeon]|nr:ABC transporter substrate-binding protein [Thermoplasmata archaeon]